jgi:hypothetical protein
MIVHTLIHNFGSLGRGKIINKPKDKDKQNSEKKQNLQKN